MDVWTWTDFAVVVWVFVVARCGGGVRAVGKFSFRFFFATSVLLSLVFHFLFLTFFFSSL